MCINLLFVIEIKMIRLHVGGLPTKIIVKDIEERFRSFGSVQKVDLIPHPFEGKKRDFITYMFIIVIDRRVMSWICVCKFGNY